MLLLIKDSLIKKGIVLESRVDFVGYRSAIERFTKEIAPLILTGPPAVTGFAGGRPKVEEIVAYWPALIPKEEITPVVEVLET